MSSRISSVLPQYVDTIPENIQPGVLYISQRFATAIHLCACGCGKEVVTPLTKGEWKLQGSSKIVSLYPSIGNWDYSCQSHYWIKQNRIIWAYKFSRKRIEAARASDNANLQKLFSPGKASIKPLSSLAKFLRLFLFGD